MVCLWNFDLLSFRRLTEGIVKALDIYSCVIHVPLGRPMFYLGMCLFEKHNLIVMLHLENAKVMKFLGKPLTRCKVHFMCVLCHSSC